MLVSCVGDYMINIKSACFMKRVFMIIASGHARVLKSCFLGVCHLCDSNGGIRATVSNMFEINSDIKVRIGFSQSCDDIRLPCNKINPL